MSKQKREYTTEFKIDAVKLVEEQGYTVKGYERALGDSHLELDTLAEPLP